MTPDGFLTFLALMVAVYAVATSVAKLRLKLEVRFLQIVTAVSAGTLTLYLLFFEALKQPCPPEFGPVCQLLVFPTDNSLPARDVAFLVILVWMLFAWLIHSFSKLGPSSLAVLSKLVDELLVEQRHAELLTLVQPHLSLIDQTSRRKLRVQRLHDWFAALSGNATIEYFLKQLDAEEEQGRNRLSGYMPRAFGRLHVIISPMRKQENYAQDILRSIYRNEGLRRFLVKQRPYAAIPLLHLKRHERSEFSEQYFAGLIADTGSALYQEVQHNQTIGRYGYVFPAYNRLLHYLFSDAEVANSLSVWKPIGDHLLRRLDPAVDPDYVAYLNGPATHFEQECWSDPTYVGIQLFRLMVNAAAYQGVKYHMWLFYLPTVLEKLEENYQDSDTSVDADAEFPTRSARLIYEIVDVLGSFVGYWDELPENSPHSLVPPLNQRDNGNIPASAALALGQCLRLIACSENLSDSFIVTIVDSIMRDIKDLDSDGQLADARAYFVRWLVSGGDAHRGNIANPTFKIGLQKAISRIDHILRDDVEDFVDAVKAI